MRTQTEPCDAVPAIESPRIRASIEQKKRSVAATVAKSLFNGNENPGAQQSFDKFDAEFIRGANLPVEQARH